MTDQQTLKHTISWVLGMSPNASTNEIQKICNSSTELDYVSKEDIESIINEIKNRNKSNLKTREKMNKKKETVTEPKPERKDYYCGRYRIISAFKDKIYHAYSYTGSKAVIKLTGDNQDAIIQELEKAVKNHIENFRQQRDAEGVPCAEEYLEALDSISNEALKMSLKVLQSHTSAQGNKFIAKDIMRDMGFETAQKAEDILAQLGRQIIRFLDFIPSSDELAAKIKPIHVIAFPKEKRGEGLWQWELRPQFEEALKKYRG